MKGTVIIIFCFIICQSIYARDWGLEMGFLPFGGNIFFDIEEGKTPAYNFSIGLTEWSFENKHGLGISYLPLEWGYSNIYGSRFSFINLELFYHFHLKQFGGVLNGGLLILLPFFSINYFNISSIYEISTMWNNITYSAGIRFMRGIIGDGMLVNGYSIEAGYRSINGKSYIYAGMRSDAVGLAGLIIQPIARILRNEKK